MAVNRPGSERDDSLDARIAQLYRLGSTETPPAHVDSAIAAAARASGKTASQPRATAWWDMWRVPFAFAALAVVSVSLVTLMWDEDRERVASVPQTAPPVVAERDSGKPQAAADSAAPGAEERKAERRQRSERTPQSSATPPAGPLPGKSEGRQAYRDEVAAQQAPLGAAGTLQKAAPTEALQSRAEAPAGVQDRAPAAAMARARPDAGAAASEEPAPASAPGKAAAPKATIGIRGLEMERRAPPPSRPSPEMAAQIVQLEGREPSVWIERISALRKEGRRAEADGLLAEFKRRYPEEAIPAFLQ